MARIADENVPTLVGSAAKGVLSIMPTIPPRSQSRRTVLSLRPEEMLEELEQCLQHPDAVLELLVARLAKGKLEGDLWSRLHEAAVRDRRLADLAFAYEQVTAERRVRTLSVEAQSELLSRATSFFADLFGDLTTAVGLAERALLVAPEKSSRLELVESGLVERGQLARLARLYLMVGRVTEDTAEQERLFAQAVEAAAAEATDRTLAIEVLDELLKLRPGRVEAARAAEEQLLALGRFRDAARRIEARLTAGGSASGEEFLLRVHLLRIYTREFPDPQKAIPQVEFVLAHEPADPDALQAAERLSAIAFVAPRALAALSDAYGKLGDWEREAAGLSAEQRSARGPRRQHVVKRLAILKQDALRDPAGAYELLGPALLSDPADDELRQRFVTLCFALDRATDAARLLGRAQQNAKDPRVRALISADLGQIHLRTGEMRRARTCFEEVVKTAPDPKSVLVAARALAELHTASGDARALALTLDVVLSLEEDTAARHAVAKRLVTLWEEELEEPLRALSAWRCLLDSELSLDALSRLEEHAERSQDRASLAELLFRHAELTGDQSERRALALRATELSIEPGMSDAEQAALFDALLDRYGPDQQVLDRLLSVLEPSRDSERYARRLEQRLALTEGQARAELLAALGRHRLERLGDIPGSIDAFEAALTLSPGQPQVREALEGMLSTPRPDPRALGLLEPWLRSEPPSVSLVRLLVHKAAAEASPDRGLGHLHEALALTEEPLHLPELAFEVGIEALRLGSAEAFEGMAELLLRVAHAAPSVRADRRAELLSTVLAGRSLDDPRARELAQLLADAWVDLGEEARATELLREALNHDPTSVELLGRLDELLSTQASPAERLQLYRGALGRETSADRRRDLLVRIASLLEREDSDGQNVEQAWREVLAVDPSNYAAHQALVVLFSRPSAEPSLLAELDRALTYLTGERRIVALDRLLATYLELGDKEKALEVALSARELSVPDDQRLLTIESLARQLERWDTVEEMLVERVARAEDLDLRITTLGALGEVREQRQKDREAAEAYRDAAALSERLGDGVRAVGLLKRSLCSCSSDQSVRTSLVDLSLQHRLFDGLEEQVRELLSVPGGERDLVRRIAELSTEGMSAVELDGFQRMVEVVRERVTDPSLSRQLRVTLASALSFGLATVPQALATYRELLEQYGARDEQIARAIESLLETAEPSAELGELSRWYYEQRVGAAADPVLVLLNWARLEETRYQNCLLAEQLLLRAVELDRERVDVWRELVRLRREKHDEQGLIAALLELSSRVPEVESRALDLQRAALLIERGGAPRAALLVLEPLVLSQPADPSLPDLLRALIRVEELVPRVAELLEQAVNLLGEPEERARALLVFLRVIESVSGFEELEARFLIAFLDAREDDAEVSLALLLEASRRLMGQMTLWERAEQIARRLGDPSPVIRAYQEVLDAGGAPSLIELLARRYVDFHEEWSEDPERSVELLEKILRICPSAEWAFERLKLAFNSQGRWAELFSLYDRVLDGLLADDARIELLREAAMAAKDFANDPDRAIAYFRKLDEVAPTDPRVEAALERLYDRQGLTRPLVELLSRQMSHASGAALLELRTRAAHLWIKLGDAAQAYQLALEIDAADKESEPVLSVLEQLTRLDTAFDTPIAVPDAPKKGKKEKRAATVTMVREAAAGRLRRYYERVERIADMVAMLEIEAEHSPDDREHQERLRRIVAIRLEHLSDEAGAFENAVRLVRLEPGNLQDRELLGRLAVSTGQNLRHAELLARLAEEHRNQPFASELFFEAAQGFELRVGEPCRAISHYATVLDHPTTSSELARDAARQLEQLLHVAGRHAERADVLTRLADLEAEPQAQRQVLGVAAQVVLEELRDAPRAVALYRKRLLLDASDGVARDGLIVALERAGAEVELLAELEERAKRSPSPQAARVDRARIARLHEARQAWSEAIDAWRRLRKLHGRDSESFEALVGLYTQTERFRELVGLLALEAETEGDSTRGRGLRRQRGQLELERLGEPLEAVRSFVGALDFARACEIARDGRFERESGRRICRELLELSVQSFRADHEDPDSPAAEPARFAFEELGRRLRAAGMISDLVDLLLEGTGIGFDRFTRRRWLREAACLCSDQLADTERAIGLLERLFAEDATDEHALFCVQRYARLLEEANRIEEVIGLWERQAAVRLAGDDPIAAGALFVRAAQLAEERLGDVERALTDYQRGADLGLDAALTAQARLYQARGQHELSAAALVTLCAQSSREVLGERSLWLADEYLAAHRPDLAQACLEEASQRASSVGAVRERLAALYEQSGAFRPLALLCATEAEESVVNEERFQLFERAASIFADKLGDHEAAIPMLKEAAALAGESLPTLIRLAEAYLAVCRPDAAMVVLREQLERYGLRRPKERALVHFLLARALVESGNRSQALEELVTAGRIDPAHPRILRLTAELAQAEHDLERAERSLRALLVLSRRDDPNSPLRTEALLALADIALLNQDRERAEEAIESAFEAGLESEREAFALEEALRTRGRDDLLVRALEQHLAQATDVVAVARVLAALVEVKHRLDLPLGPREADLRKRALEVESALTSQAGEISAALGPLAQFYATLGDLVAAARIERLQVEAYLDPARTLTDPEVLFELGAHQLTMEGGHAAALGLLERASVLSADYPRIRAILDPVFDLSPDWEDGFELLERVARRAHRKDWLVEVLERRVMGQNRTLAQIEEMLTLARELGEPQTLMRLLELVTRDPIASELSPQRRAGLRLELAHWAERSSDLEWTVNLREAACEDLGPEDAEAILLDVAQVLSSRLGERRRAAAIYDRLHRRDPGRREFFEPLLAELAELEDDAARLEVIERALGAAVEPGARRTLALDRARLLLRAGEEERASQLLGELLCSEPEYTPAALLLSDLFVQQGRNDELRSLLEGQLDLAFERGNVLDVQVFGLKLAAFVEELGFFEPALSVLSRVLQATPNHRAALEATARLAERVSDFARAAEALSRLVPLLGSEELRPTFERLIVLWECVGDESAVEASLRRAIELVPGSRPFINRLVTRLSGRQDYAGALEVLRIALCAEPDSGELLLEQIKLLREMGESAQALAVADELLEKGEDSPGLHRERGLLLVSLQRIEEGISELERGELNSEAGAEALLTGLRIARKNAEGAGDLSLGLREVELLLALGAIDQSRLVLSELSERFPDDRQLLRTRASIARSEEDWSTLVDICSVLAETAQESELTELVLSLAQAAEILDEPARARAALERAFSVDPEHEELRARLASVYRKLGATRELGALLLDGARRLEDTLARQARLVEIAQLLLENDTDLAGAEAILEEARGLTPEALEITVLASRVARRLGRGEQALSMLEEAASAQKGRRSRALSHVYREMSQIQLEDGFLTDALDSLVKATEMDIRNGGLAMELARLALEIDEKDVAYRTLGRVALMKLVDGDPNEGVEREDRAAANYELAVHASGQGDLRKAKVLLQKVLADVAEHEPALALLAEIG